jgi:hypothetical protein
MSSGEQFVVSPDNRGGVHAPYPAGYRVADTARFVRGVGVIASWLALGMRSGSVRRVRPGGGHHRALHRSNAPDRSPGPVTSCPIA